MAREVLRIQAYNDHLKIIFNDGTSQLAIPASAGALWVPQLNFILVTPTAPVQSANILSFPDIQGVQYRIGGSNISGSVVIGDNTTVYIDAVPKSGYKFPPGTWAWSYTYTPPAAGFKFPFPRSSIDFESYFGHSGVDWPGSRVGTSATIRAIGPGTVVGRTTNTVNDTSDFSEPTWRGCSITLDHGTIDGINIKSLYSHMASPPIVNIGDSVSGGQAIGTIGQSGAAFGIHLHLEVIYNGSRLPTATPGNNTPGLGFQRTLNWLDSHTDGSSW